MDDGSTDETSNIIKEYEYIDDRIKLVFKKNTGVSDTRNIGLDIAKGVYISFIDSDDYIKNNFL